MALIIKRFGNFRFRRNPNFKFKSNFNRFHRGGSSTLNSSRGGYKTRMVDRSKIRCFNCNEMGHFATECKKPRQFNNTSYDVSQKKKSGSKDEVNCFYAKASSDERLLWNKRLSHLNFKTMNSLVKRELV